MSACVFRFGKVVLSSVEVRMSLEKKRAGAITFRMVLMYLQVESIPKRYRKIPNPIHRDSNDLKDTRRSCRSLRPNATRIKVISNPARTCVRSGLFSWNLSQRRGQEPRVHQAGSQHSKARRYDDSFGPPTQPTHAEDGTVTKTIPPRWLRHDGGSNPILSPDGRHRHHHRQKRVPTDLHLPSWVKPLRVWVCIVKTVQ